MEILKLKAEVREKTGGLSSRKAIYQNKLVPGVVYGGKDAPVAIQVKNNELLKIINNESVFNSLVELELADKKHNVVFKDVQKHPSKNIFVHFDLQKVSKGTKINITVPIVLTNQDKCFGVKIEGGVINHVLKELSVIVDPNNIPEFIEVNMEEIKSKEKVRLSALDKNSSYSFPKSLKNQDPVIVSVLTARGGAMLLEDEVEEGTVAVEGEETTQESDNEKAPEGNKSDNSAEKSE
jgi:large subunit ribosomal protein L25